MKYVKVGFGGEVWVEYPLGMRFPRAFRTNYPFRGRGVVSRILYCLNYLRLDRILFRSYENPHLDKIGFNDVAYFWPSRERSSGRFYGYRVENGIVVEYLKFGSTEIERAKLSKEADNVVKISSVPGMLFEVPSCLGVELHHGVIVVRYVPLPSTARSLPVSCSWYDKIDVVRRQIAEAGYSHGDFSWHNFKTDGTRVWILDWEEMRSCVDPGVDEMSLKYGYAIYWQHKTLDEALADFDMRKLSCVRDLAERNISPGRIMLKYLQDKGRLS